MEKLFFKTISNINVFYKIEGKLNENTYVVCPNKYTKFVSTVIDFDILIMMYILSIKNQIIQAINMFYNYAGDRINRHNNFYSTFLFCYYKTTSVIIISYKIY